MTTATATNKVNWAKVARKTLRFSWWVVVFVTKLIIFVGLLILKFFELINAKPVEEQEKKMKDHDFYYSDPDEPGSEYSGDSGRL